MYVCRCRDNAGGLHTKHKIAYLWEATKVRKRHVFRRTEEFILFEFFINRMYSFISCMIENKLISKKIM